jgi:sugar lactone lactonase YvrE
MKRFVITLALAVVLLVALAAPAGASTAVWQPRTVATFSPGDYGAFAESLAADRSGNLFATVTSWGMEANVGEVWKITPCGDMTLAATVDVGPGMLTGIAFDAAGHLYVAAATFSDVPLPGVFRIATDGSVKRVMTLPVQSFPNGLACREGYLYVSDSSLGAVWRARSTAGSSPSAPWFKNALLKPSMNGLGANGIAFFGNQLFVAASDSGRIVRVPVKTDGSAGTLTVVANLKALRSADGIAFDVLGGLWITTNHSAGVNPAGTSGGLYRLSPHGTLETIASSPDWLDYPSMPVFGTTPDTRTTLFVTNGSFENGTPNLIALDAGVAGLPLF